MNKNIIAKRSASIVLCLMIVLTLLPLCAFAAGEEYKVIYDAQGGDNCPDPTVSDSKDISVTSNIPTKEGYFFTGWNTMSDGNGTDYRAGDKVSFDEESSVTLYACWLQLYVGNVEVNDKNASDILGDGAFSYDKSTNTLTINNASLDSYYEYEEGCVSGILADGDLNIRSIGESKITAPDAKYSSCGIYVVGDLYISGEGKLTFRGGNTYAELKKNDTLESIGVCTIDSLTVDGTTLEAYAGNVEAVTEEDMDEMTAAYSQGISSGALYIKNAAKVVAQAKNASARSSYSDGIQAYGEIIIDASSVTATGGDCVSKMGYSDIYSRANCTGIYAQYGLIVTNKSYLEATSGSASAARADSYGIMSLYGKTSISDSTVQLVGGKVIGTDDPAKEQSYACVAGFYSNQDITICDDSTFISKGGEAKGDLAYSLGIYTYGNVNIIDSYADCQSSESTGKDRAESVGMDIWRSSLNVKGSRSIVSASSKNAVSDTKAFSNGISIFGGDINISGGNIDVKSGEASAPTRDGYTLYVKRTNIGDDTYAGGSINITSDEIGISKVGNGFICTSVKLSSECDGTVYATQGINISEILKIKSPENAVIEGCKDLETESNEISYYTIKDADGNKASNASIGIYTHSITVKGDSFGKRVDVPFGWSANKAHCARFDTDDIANILASGKDGYILGGFYTSESFDEGTKYDFNSILTEDITVYIKYIPLHSVTVNKSEGGEVLSDKESAVAGDKITLTVNASAEYELDSISVTDELGNKTEVTLNADGTYSFIQPDGNVTVNAVFKSKKPSQSVSDGDNDTTDEITSSSDTANDNANDNASGSEDKKGCGSVISGIGGIFAAVAISAAITFKKKEDRI